MKQLKWSEFKAKRACELDLGEPIELTADGVVVAVIMNPAQYLELLKPNFKFKPICAQIIKGKVVYIK